MKFSESGSVGVDPTAASGSNHTAHIWRLIALVAIAFTGGALVRRSLQPATFGLQGHFRAAALDELAARPLRHVGKDVCDDCHLHDEIWKKAAGGAHQVIACENCHGPARGHAVESQARVKLTVNTSPDACLICHAKVQGRPDSHKQIDLREHSSSWDFKIGDKCIECHDPHSPTEAPPTEATP